MNMFNQLGYGGFGMPSSGMYGGFGAVGGFNTGFGQVPVVQPQPIMNNSSFTQQPLLQSPIQPQTAVYQDPNQFNNQNQLNNQNQWGNNNAYTDPNAFNNNQFGQPTQIQSQPVYLQNNNFGGTYQNNFGQPGIMASNMGAFNTYQQQYY